MDTFANGLVILGYLIFFSKASVCDPGRGTVSSVPPSMIRAPTYRHPRWAVAGACSDPNRKGNLAGGFFGALMRHARAPQTKLATALRVWRLAVQG
jgi:hypothetical protein